MVTEMGAREGGGPCGVVVVETNMPVCIAIGALLVPLTGAKGSYVG